MEDAALLLLLLLFLFPSARQRLEESGRSFGSSCFRARTFRILSIIDLTKHLQELCQCKDAKMGQDLLKLRQDARRFPGDTFSRSSPRHYGTF
jgi:hypothetical protein